MEYINLPDLRSLATLRAIVELGGMESAGRALHVGQPAITKRLRALDDCYGIKLMHRQGRRLVLTPAGEKVYAYARLVLDYQALLLEDLASLRVGENRLRLEVTTAIGEHLLPALLLQFNKTYPHFRIDSNMGYSRRIQSRMAGGLVDLALMELAPDHPDILVQKWLDDELLLVCGPGHPLWETDLLPVAELSRLHYVLREPKAAIRILVDKALQDIGIPHIPVSMELNSTKTIMVMLEQGRHVSFLPRFAVVEALAEQRLYHIKIEGLRIKRTLWIARSRTQLNNPVAESFIRLLRGEQP